LAGPTGGEAPPDGTPMDEPISSPPPPVGKAAGPEPSAAEPDVGGWAELLRNRRYRLLTGAGACAGAGYAVYTVSVLYVAYGLTGNLLAPGLVLFIEYGVYTLTFLLAPIVDRARDKRTLLLACYPVQALAAVSLALALRTGTLTVPILLVLVLVLAVGWDFVWAVYNVAPRLVLPKRALFLGESLSSLLSTGTQVGGYAVGGALLYVVGPYGGAAAYGGLLLAAFGLTLPLALPVDAPPVERFWRTFASGWAAFRGTAGRALRALAALESYVGFFGALPPLLVTAIAYQRFADPAAAYGALVTAYALGGALAVVAVGHANPRGSVGRLLVACPAIAGALLLSLPFLPAQVLAIGLALAAIGGATSVRYSAKYIWVQGTYAPELLGRLTSNLFLFTGVSSTAAVLLLGALSERLPVPALEGLAGAGLLGGAVLTVVLPEVRRLAF
jgi:hypothetical protein